MRKGGVGIGFLREDQIAGFLDRRTARADTIDLLFLRKLDTPTRALSNHGDFRRSLRRGRIHASRISRNQEGRIYAAPT